MNTTSTGRQLKRYTSEQAVDEFVHIPAEQTEHRTFISDNAAPSSPSLSSDEVPISSHVLSAPTSRQIVRMSSDDAVQAFLSS